MQVMCSLNVLYNQINMPQRYLIINALIPITKHNILSAGDGTTDIQLWDGPTGVAPSQKMSCPIFPKFETMPCRLHDPFITTICWQSHCFNTLSSLFINNKQCFLRNMVKIALKKKPLSMSSILKDGTTAVAPSALPQ